MQSYEMVSVAPSCLASSDVSIAGWSHFQCPACVPAQSNSTFFANSMLSVGLVCPSRSRIARRSVLAVSPMTHSPTSSRHVTGRACHRRSSSRYWNIMHSNTMTRSTVISIRLLLLRTIALRITLLPNLLMAMMNPRVEDDQVPGIYRKAMLAKSSLHQ